MDTILDMLYILLHNDLASPEERAVLNREEAFLDEMERRLGREDFTRFWDAVSEIGALHAKADFQLGFQLGAHLILEAKKNCFPQK